MPMRLIVTGKDFVRPGLLAALAAEGVAFAIERHLRDEHRCPICGANVRGKPQLKRCEALCDFCFRPLSCYVDDGGTCITVANGSTGP